MRKVYLLLVIALVSMGCEKANQTITAKKAIEITDASWAEHVPQVDLKRFATRVEDLGEAWRITYYVPEGSTGGPFIFVVNKKSGEIVSSEGGQ
ncbi:MAG TPA: hypothetical protein VF680_13175 [Allosphingosinicella sp.]